jgi:hypothetical protein
MIEKNKLRFVIGPTPNMDFKVFLGEEDISDKLMVKSFSTKLDANTGFTTVSMEVYSDQMEILADVVNVNVVNWPRRTVLGHLRNLKDLFMLHIGDQIVRKLRIAR